MSTLIKHAQTLPLVRQPRNLLETVFPSIKWNLESHERERLTFSSGLLKGSKDSEAQKKSGRWGFRPLWAWGDGGALISEPDGAGGATPNLEYIAILPSRTRRVDRPQGSIRSGTVVLPKLLRPKERLRRSPPIQPECGVLILRVAAEPPAALSLYKVRLRP